MDVHHLNYFITIAECKNMTKAAKKLYVSQSTLSQYLAKLEQEVETTLFDRSRGELTLTSAGRLYLNCAEQMVAMKENLYREIAALDHKGHISIGTTSNFGLHLLAELIPVYKKEFPEVTLEISELSLPLLKQQIEQEILDFGIAASHIEDILPSQTTTMKTEPIYLAVCAASHFARAHAQTRTVTAADLKELFQSEALISTKNGSSIRQVMEPVLLENGIDPTIICETNHIHSTLNMVSKHVGAAFIGQSCLTDLDNIKYYELNPRRFRYNVLITRKNWPQTKPEQTFYGMVKKYLSISPDTDPPAFLGGG